MFCSGKQSGKYCTDEKKQICPNHWWGNPVCGPCNCDVAKGFKEKCDKKTGKCSCKDYFYQDDDITSCKPCNCHKLGSVDQTCDVTSGQCNCKSGIIGKQCDLCAHQFAELGPGGCSVVYGHCPAEVASKIKWKRIPIGKNTTSFCPTENSKGKATRSCSKSGWNPPNTSDCIHNVFLKLKFTSVDFNDEPWKNIFMAYKVVSNKENILNLYPKDISTTYHLVKFILKEEIAKNDLEFAHMKERNFLSNLFYVVSWLYDNIRDAEQKSEMLTLINKYGQTISSNMDKTFTNPLEIVSNNVIFGLDHVNNDIHDSLIKIPKYNNYMRRPNSWNKISAFISKKDKDEKFNIQYSEFNNTGKFIDRSQVMLRGLRWGTSIRYFSNVFTFQINKEEEKRKLTKRDLSLLENEEENIPKINYHGYLKHRHNRLYCAYMDNSIWTSLDCESDYSLPETERTLVSINCSCIPEGTFTVFEELIEEQNEYLDNDFITIIFLSITGILNLILIFVIFILSALNYKNSVAIHRNITCMFTCQQALLIISVGFNTSLLDLDVVCKLITMGLHYFSITTFLWALIDSVHIYRMLKELRDINHGKMSFYTVTGFGFPAIIVGLTVGVSGNNYGSATFCWLTYQNYTSWSMFIPEILSAAAQIGFMFASLNAVFNIRGDIEDFSKLRRVFFVNAGLLPLIAGSNIAAFILINFRTPMFIYIYLGCSVATTFYILFGFIIGDPMVIKPLKNCSFSSQHQYPNTTIPHQTSTLDKQALHISSHLSRSALNYHTTSMNRGYVHGGGSVTSTTSRSSHHFKESMNSTDDDKLYTNMFNVSESDSDIERRSLDLASSHSSDEDNDPEPSRYNSSSASTYKKTLYVNDYPTHH